MNVPSREVSGDFYDLVPAAGGALLVAIADVCGKGVPAALQSALLQASVRTQADGVASVGAILGTGNALLHRSTPVGQFATFVLARVEAGERRLAYANAGQNHPILLRAGGARVRLDRGGVPLGILEGAAYDEGVLEIEPGDRVVFYTDGVTEAARSDGEQYGEQRLCDLVAGLPGDRPARETVERILQDVRAWLDGTEAGDDITLLVLAARDDAPRG